MKRQLSTNIDFEIRSPLLKSIILAVCIVSILSFSAYQLIVFRSKVASLTTQTALTQTVSRTENTQAFFVRQEEYLDSVRTGTVVPAYSNGSKVGIGDIVAKVFRSEASAATASLKATVENEIAYYEGIAALSAGSLPTSVEIYNSNVVSDLLNLQDSIASNLLENIPAQMLEFSESLTKKQISTGGSADVSLKLEQLYAELNRIEAATSDYTAVTASKAGYYVNETDGYENTADYVNIRSITPGEVDALIAAPPVSANYMGKLITSFNWYMVCNVDEDAAMALSVGDTVSVGISSYSDGELKMILRSKNTGDGGKTALVMSSNIMNAEIAALRKATVNIRTEEYSGLAVDKKAVRTVEGESGVYIQLGNIVRFRKINIIYSDENIIIVKAPENEGGYLQLYDEIITEGTDLYDGKIIE